MITGHPYRAVGVPLAVMAVAAFPAARIGQDDEGLWGGLPEWLATASWATFLASILVISALSVLLPIADLRLRRTAR